MSFENFYILENLPASCHEGQFSSANASRGSALDLQGVSSLWWQTFPYCLCLTLLVWLRFTFSSSSREQSFLYPISSDVLSLLFSVPVNPGRKDS